MKKRSGIRISGLRKPNGDNYTIYVEEPKRTDHGFACKIDIPGIMNREIFQESPLSALADALKLVERQIFPPSPLIMMETTLECDDFADLLLEFDSE